MTVFWQPDILFWKANIFNFFYNESYHIKDVIHKRDRNTFLRTNNPVRRKESVKQKFTIPMKYNKVRILVQAILLAFKTVKAPPKNQTNNEDGLEYKIKN